MAPIILIVIATFLFSPAFSVSAYQATPEERKTISILKGELIRLQMKVKETEKENKKYSGGLIKSLILVRLEILKTDLALLNKKIHSLQTGAKLKIVENATKPDPELASVLANEIQGQNEKVREAKANAARYSGGLVRAMALSALATSQNTLAMLEQRYFVAKYGLSLPSLKKRSSEKSAELTTKNTQKRKAKKKCLSLATYNSSVLDRNNSFWEVAWKVDLKNSCDQTFVVKVIFTFFDKDEYKLHSDDKTIRVPANGIGKARGKELISPPEKAQRMARIGVAYRILR